MSLLSTRNDAPSTDGTHVKAADDAGASPSASGPSAAPAAWSEAAD